MKQNITHESNLSGKTSNEEILHVEVMLLENTLIIYICQTWYTSIHSFFDVVKCIKILVHTLFHLSYCRMW